MSKLVTTIGVAFIALGAVLPNAAQAASLTFITNRTALGGNDLVDWQGVGRAFSQVPNNFSVKSSGGLELTVSKASGNFLRAEQTSASDGPFSANFAFRDALIYTGSQLRTPSTVTIAFSSPINGVGTQLESSGDGPFTATIEALDSNGEILGSFSTQGIAKWGGRGDNTAPFVGVLSDSANIASVRINGERRPGSGFAFNQVDLVVKPVPEPDSSELTAITFGGCIGGGLLLRRQRNKKLQPK